MQIITGGDKITDAQFLKDTAIQVFKEAGFVLHKWHSNFPELEENNPKQILTEQTYAKRQLSVKTAETKMLGSKQDKKKDKCNIEIPPPIRKTTKRNALQKLATIYDVLELYFHARLQQKMFLLKSFGEKISWDKEIPPEITNIWLKWEKVLPSYPAVFSNFILILVKNALYKTVGKTTLSQRELEEVFIDVENTLNNRPLRYAGDDEVYI